MKLFLASNGGVINDEGFDLLNKPYDQIKLLWIITASKRVDDLTYLKTHSERMDEKGIQYQEFDLTDKSEEEIRNALKDVDAVHVEGGNTYYLLKVIKETGFDKILPEYLEKGLVYFGSSAGAYIVCPTIETSNWKVSEKDLHDECGLTDFTAMNLVPFIIKVHYKPEQKDFLKEKIRETKYPVKILKDGQALLVEDGKVSLVGDKEEIKL